MKVSLNNTKTQQPSFKGLYNSKLLLKGLEFAADYPAIFTSTVSLGLSTFARPASILATPKTDKENKKHACAKSIASSAVGCLVMLTTLPVSFAIKKINNNPSKHLKQSTIQNLKGEAKELINSKSYQLATQIFKLGTGLLLAIPKSAITCLLIPPVLTLFFSTKKHNTRPNSPVRANSNVISFKGICNSASSKIAKCIGKIIDLKPVQEFAKKFSDTNFALHVMNLTDIVLTWAFIQRTKHNKKIEEARKKALIYNTEIATGLSITGGYALHYATKNSEEKFIQKFREIHKNSPKLEKYIEGIKIAKPALILGGIYYIIIPIISTFLADRADTTPRSH